MKLILASNNEKKLVEMRKILSHMGYDVITQRDAGINIEVEETGATFAQNAFLKASAVAELSGCVAVADDSGIAVEALGGEPGVFSARYGGEKCRSDADRLELLLKNMEGASDRRARFVSSIACVFPGGDIVRAEGVWDGMLTSAPVGEGGFGYDPIFYVPEYGMTAAQMSPEQKNKVSHRARALGEFKIKLEKYEAENSTGQGMG